MISHFENEPAAETSDWKNLVALAVARYAADFGIQTIPEGTQILASVETGSREIMISIADGDARTYTFEELGL